MIKRIAKRIMLAMCLGAAAVIFVLSCRQFHPFVD